MAAIDAAGRSATPSEDWLEQEHSIPGWIQRGEFEHRPPVDPHSQGTGVAAYVSCKEMDTVAETRKPFQPETVSPGTAGIATHGDEWTLVVSPCTTGTQTDGRLQSVKRVKTREWTELVGGRMVKTGDRDHQRDSISTMER